MKKLLSILLCLAMVLSLTFVLAGCNDDKKEESSASDKDEDKDSDKDTDKDSDKDQDKDSDKDEDKDSDKDEDKDSDKKEDTIVGTWEASLQLTEYYDKATLEAAYGFMAEYMDFDSLYVDVIATFGESKMTMEFETESIKKDLLVEIKKAMGEYCKAEFDMTLEEYCEESGQSWDELEASLAEQMDTMFPADLSMEYNYKWEPGKLYSWLDGAQEPGEDAYEKCEIDGDEMTLSNDQFTFNFKRK